MSDPAPIPMASAYRPDQAALLAEAIAALEILRTWYVAHGDTKAPLAPWVAADKLLTRLRAALEGDRP